MSAEQVLDVADLSIGVAGPAGRSLVHGVSFSVGRGEIVGIVGESGSGKTLCSLAVARLLPRGLQMSATRLTFAGHSLLDKPNASMRAALGTDMGLVFQDPMSSLNPARRIGSQMVESVRRHRGMSAKDARELARESLAAVRISEPERRLRQHPHELSGGMRQRVMIATALMSKPALVIADEPTTALDVTVQAQVMQLLHDLNRGIGSAILIISHNISLLSEICDRILVMYRGNLVESLTVEQLLSGPEHPYTSALMAAVPDLGMDRSRELATIDEEMLATSTGGEPRA